MRIKYRYMNAKELGLNACEFFKLPIEFVNSTYYYLTSQRALNNQNMLALQNNYIKCYQFCQWNYIVEDNQILFIHIFRFFQGYFYLNLMANILYSLVIYYSGKCHFLQSACFFKRSKEGNPIWKLNQVRSKLLKCSTICRILHNFNKI